MYSEGPERCVRRAERCIQKEVEDVFGRTGKMYSEGPGRCIWKDLEDAFGRASMIHLEGFSTIV
eukprot:6383684-Karenia_brevis.AAC.1